MQELVNQIFSIQTAEEFNQCSLAVFRFQAKNCEVYKTYLETLNFDVSKVNNWTEIPFLPVEFFKNHKIYCGTEDEKIIFTSSGTTGAITSRHFVADPASYQRSFSQCFQQFYGNPSHYQIFALLPAYLEREGSSLVYMAESLIAQSQQPGSGFYLYNHAELYDHLLKAISQKIPGLLLGVSFALLDFAEAYQLPENNLVVMETGGMKGRRKELTRDEMHRFLTKKLGVGQIHSEYGMTELLSQAYSQGNGRYHCPPWMRTRIREIYDPFSYLPAGQTGGVNIVDLANLYSCSFIETKDLGRQFDDGGFEILGRFDHSDIRGCNLMVS